ncbi:MAG: VanW family protein [Sandaracinaceae bacterium]|nr:VanW family protein [Sandaracinaceae bacterium]
MTAASLARPRSPARPLRWGTLAGGCAIVALLGYSAWALAQHEASSLTVAGVALPADGDPEPFVRQLAQQWHETELSIDAGSQIVRATRREIGARVDADAAVEQARVGRGHAPIWSRLAAFATQRPRAIAWSREVSTEEVARFVEELRDRTVVDPEPREHDGRGGRPGTGLNTVGAARALTDALHTDALVVRLPVRRVEAPVAPVRSARTALFTEVVSAHETRYAGTGELVGRARNIELAAQALDGEVIPPRSTLSFNDVVGERSVERGFAPAIELAREGRRVEGIGGGVCQVAATLHAAAFFAGFDIVEHHPHTRNSLYIPAGLDAAVSWPNKDLVIRNTHPFHVRVRATAYRGTLRIELMGARRAPRVEWNTHILRRDRITTQTESDPNLPLGSEEVLDPGEEGSVMERTRTVYWEHAARTDTVTLRYPMVTRLVRTGPQSVRVAQ